MTNQQQQSIFIDNHDNGVIHIHKDQEKPKPQESLGPPKSLRWTPTEMDDLKARARLEGKDFNPFIREVTQIANHYSTSEIVQLIRDRVLYRKIMENRDLFVNLINSLRKA